jgi:hypothetical protein
MWRAGVLCAVLAACLCACSMHTLALSRSPVLWHETGGYVTYGPANDGKTSVAIEVYRIQMGTRLVAWLKPRDGAPPICLGELETRLQGDQSTLSGILKTSTTLSDFEIFLANQSGDAHPADPPLLWANVHTK